jgi:hypothetical protein
MIHDPVQSSDGAVRAALTWFIVIDPNTTRSGKQSAGKRLRQVTTGTADKPVERAR